jgi:hypothetical protein
MNSSGHSFDALAKYKSTTDKLDKFLIYRAMNGKLSCGPSYVFKSSKVQLQMALAMDKDTDGLLKTEVCFADGNYKRCPGYVTLTLWVRLTVTCILYCYIHVSQKSGAQLLSLIIQRFSLSNYLCVKSYQLLHEPADLDAANFSNLAYE